VRLRTYHDMDPRRGLEPDTETSFLDVGGLNLLLDAHRGAIACGTTFCLTGCGRQVLRVLHFAEVIEVLRLVPKYRMCGGSGQSEATGSTAHTDLPSSNSITPHRIDRAATTCSPRPRGARGSWSRGLRRRAPVVVPHLNPHALTVDADGQLAPGARVVDHVRHQLGGHQQRVIADLAIRPPLTARGSDGGTRESRRLRLRQQPPTTVRLARTVALHNELVPVRSQRNARR
jgi:hypothetical protein